MSVSVIIPAYNEEVRLARFLESVVSYVSRHRTEIREVIVVDDGSTDQTVAIVERYQRRLPGLRVIQHATNRGKGSAVQTGVLAARGELVVFMDADGATPISELPKMITALRDADVAIGNRWMKDAQVERHSLLRRLSGWVYRRYMGLFGLGAVDTMCGFKGYHHLVARDLFTHLLEERWLFDTEVAYRALRRGYGIVNFPIRWVSQDGSKLPARTLFTSALRIWPLIRRVKRAERRRTRAETH